MPQLQKATSSDQACLSRRDIRKLIARGASLGTGARILLWSGHAGGPLRHASICRTRQDIRFWAARDLTGRQN